MAIGRKLSLTPNVKSKKINVTATADQTLFTVTGGYRVNNIGVYRNGALLAVGSDFLANDGSTVTLLTAATAGDIVQFEVFDTHELTDSINANGDQVLNGALTVTGIVSASSINIGSAITFVTGEGINVTGVVTATSVEVGNNIKIGNAGVITATSFSGDGANLTNVGVDTATVNTGALKVSGISTLTGVVKASSDVRVTGNLNAGITTLGAVTVTSITGDGSGLTGVANTDFIVSVAQTTSRLTVNSDANIVGVSTFTGTTTLGKVTLGIGKSINYNNVQKAFFSDHAVGVGTTTKTGRDAGIGTAPGTIVFNVTNDKLQVYSVSLGWVDVSNVPFNASGGTETTDRSGFKVHEFTSPGTFTVSSGEKDVEVMVIGGGGAGGGSPGNGSQGGGGAGALYFNNAVPVSTGSYTVTVGSGGPGNSGPSFGPTGGESSFSPSYPAAGGGGGGTRHSTNGRPGGSGGGAGNGPGSAGPATGAPGGSTDANSPAAGWGNPGGGTPSAANGGNNFPAAGGGGAGQGASPAPDQGPGQGSPGGNGLTMAIEGPSQTFAGGGGGGTHQNGPQPSGGSGGGGAGSVHAADGSAGSANTGGGGGGSGSTGSGGSGGSGKVVIAYQE